MCGEKGKLIPFYVDEVGSPPRMRGKEALSNMIARTVRITPAYAGKRSKSMTLRSLRGDHPRVCGEKALCPSTVSPT